jgi:hypothetical protein
MVQYVSNATPHADIGISYVHEVIHQKCNKYHTRLEPTKTRSSKQEEKTDDSKETGQLTWFEVPGIRRWTTPHQDIEIITTFWLLIQIVNNNKKLKICLKLCMVIKLGLSHGRIKTGKVAIMRVEELHN